MEILWVRVLYKPRGDPTGWWTIGWVFPSDTMAGARQTIRKFGDWRKWDFNLILVKPGDFDHPDNREAWEKYVRAHPCAPPGDRNA